MSPKPALASPAPRTIHRRQAPGHPKSRTPRGHWFLVSLVIFVFAVGLLIEGYTRGVLGENSADEPASASHAQAAPASVTGGGPVISVTGAQAHSYQIPPKTAVLSFDDGPDPTWTPKVLAVLKRLHVPGTFFLVGAHVASYPSLVRAELADGDEVGSHTYTHANLATAGTWRENLELTLAQNALAGAAGVHTRLLRMPFSSEPDAITAADWRAASQAGRDGYLVVFTSLDTRDWAKPGVSHIMAAAMPSRGRGAIIMFHDSGGDRSETVTALPRIIQRLRAKGYRFTTVTGALRLAAGDVPVSGSQRLVGATLVFTQQTADHAVAILAVALIVMSVLTVIRLLALIGFAAAHRRRERRKPRSIRPNAPAFLPDVSVIIPAYNEAAGIAATIRSMAESDYRGRLEIVVVSDGSTDNTAKIARSLRIPYVHVITQRNSGKPGALNRGIAAAQSEVLILVDGDTVFERNTIERLVAPLADWRVGAVSGNTKVGNRRGFLGGWQHLEYVMGFNLDRRMYDMLGIMPTVPGAIGAFRRDALAMVGGVSHDTLAEDTDLTMALCRTPWRIVYAPEATAWTEAPSTLRQLWRQRYRWSYGTMQAMWKHRSAVIERGDSGRFGRLCLPYLALFQITLPLVAPAIDVFSLYGLMFLNPVQVAAFWLSFTALQAISGGYALWLDSERLRALWVMPFQQVVYRQLMYLVTIQSVITALLGTRQRWQAIRRAGVFSGRPLPQDQSRLPSAGAADAHPFEAPPLTFEPSRRFTVGDMTLMRISQLAERSGVPATTLRFYEDAGLLPADRTAAGYRVYGEDALDRLRFISTGKHLGLSLEEIGELLGAWETGTCAEVKAALRPRIAARLAEAGQRATGLRAFLASLQGALEHLDTLPDGAGRCGQECEFPAATPAPPRPTEIMLLPGPKAAERERERWRTVPVTCSLSGDGMADRAAAWRRVLNGAVRAEIPDGLRLTLPASRTAAIAGLAAAEQECCPFFDFRLHLDGQVLRLEVRAPADGADLLAGLFSPA